MAFYVEDTRDDTTYYGFAIELETGACKKDSSVHDFLSAILE